MKRNKLCVLLISFLCVNIAAGCAGKSEDGEKNPIKLTSVMEYTTIEKEGPKGTTPQKNSFNRTAKEKLNIDVEWLWIAPEGQYEQKLDVSIANGSIPDFMAIKDGTTYRKLLESNQIMPWNEVLEGASDTLKEWIFRDPKVIETVTNENGEIMALPQYWDTKRQVNIMMIRKDWLDELGLPIPQTVEELEETAIAFREKTEADQGIGLTYKVFGNSVGSMSGLLHMMGAYPGAWIEENGRLVPGEISSKTKEGLSVLNRFYREGILNAEFPLYDYDKLKEEVLNEKLGIVIAPFWEYDSMIGKEIAKNQDSKWITAPIPMSPGTKGTLMDTVSIEKYWVISRKCENPKEVIKLFNLFVEFETDYPKEAKIENGFIWEWAAAQYFDSNDIDEIYETFNMQIQTGDLITPPNVTNRLLSYWEDCKDYYEWKENGGIYPADNDWGIYMARVDKDGAWATVRKLVEDGKYERNCYYGFPTDVMNSRQDVLNKMTEETFLKIVMGETPIEQFEEYREKWLQLGGMELIEEVNKWYLELE